MGTGETRATAEGSGGPGRSRSGTGEMGGMCRVPAGSVAGGSAVPGARGGPGRPWPRWPILPAVPEGTGRPQDTPAALRLLPLLLHRDKPRGRFESVRLVMPRVKAHGIAPGAHCPPV